MQTFKTRPNPKLNLSFIPKKQTRPVLHLTTMILLSFLGLVLGIAISWLLGNYHVAETFASIQPLQDNPPAWLQVPQVSNKYFLLVPTLVLFLFVQVFTKVFPNPVNWSRRLVAGILVCLLVRYLLWRSFSTLNLTNPVDGVFSLLLMGMELIAISGGMIQLLLMFTTKDRQREADIYSKSVVNEVYNPSVDIMIPTYNEPEFILRRTIIGCQGINYAKKKVYLLDDTKRPEIQRLATELGCEYLTRKDNDHAKAGNLNAALAKTSGELIVFFDADFVPTKNFLERTVGFFQKEKIALVQTPQSFYNPDPIARNLGLEDVLTSEEEVFYRQMQPIKDGAGSVVCAGTSFIARREALESIGGFVTESLSEDYFTGIRLAAFGYELVYLDEKLSAGLAAENISSHIEQRMRWGRGTLQAFFIDSNPLTIPGLSLWQRLGHFEGLLHWFNSIPRIFFLLLPIFSVFFGINPFSSTFREAVYFFVPYYVTQITVFAWLNMRSRSALLSDLYSLVQCFPISITVIKAMIRPFAKGFKVTPKGLASNRYYYNWSLALPLIILLTLSFASFSICLIQDGSPLNISIWWGAYNVLTLSGALLVLLDSPKLSAYQWFKTNRQVDIITDEQVIQGKTLKLSEEGMEIAINQKIFLSENVTLSLVEENIKLEGIVTKTQFKDNQTLVKFKFTTVPLANQRELVKTLYCQPGQWQKKQAPGELDSLLILFKLLVRPIDFVIKRQLKLVKPSLS